MTRLRFLGPRVARLWPALALVCAAAVVGCGGQTGGAYGQQGYTDPSLSSNGMGMPGSPLTTRPNGVAGTPNVAMWPSTKDGKRIFVAGINVACFGNALGHDLGKDPLKPDTAVWYKGDEVSKTLKNFSQSGFNVIRVTLFEKGQGLTFDKSGHVSGIDGAFSKNLMDLVNRAQKEKLKLYVCLSDASWSGLVEKGVKDPLMDPKAQDAYTKNAVSPVTRKLKANEAVFGFDLYNEIDGSVAGDDGNGTKDGATWDQVRDYVKSCITTIKENDPQRLVTISTGPRGVQPIMKGYLKGLTLDLYDVHAYDDKGSLPQVTSLSLDRPLLLGGFGPSTANATDTAQESADSAFVQNAVAKGYAGYVASTYGGGGPQNLLTEDGKPKPAMTSIEKLLTLRPQ